MISIKNIYSLLLTVYILASLLIPLASFNKLIFVVLVLIYGGYILFIKKENEFNHSLIFLLFDLIRYRTS